MSDPTMESLEGKLIWPKDYPGEIKTCQSCAYLVGVRDYDTVSNSWGCGKVHLGTDVVTGRKVYKLCIEVRSNSVLCSLEGKWFKLYEKPDYYKLKPAEPKSLAEEL